MRPTHLLAAVLFLAGTSIAEQAVTSVPLKLGDATVIGASVSAGCEACLPGFPPANIMDPKGHADLAGALAAITGGPAPSGGGDTMFFMGAKEAAEQQIAAAKARNPKILFAIDFLFWHGYGSDKDAVARMAMLEDGLAKLDTFACTIVIGDLPDMAHAIDRMLAKEHVPDLETIGKLNAKIREWAGSRPRVVIVPIFETVAKLMKSEKVTFGGHTYEGAESRGLLTDSGLHVTMNGLIALALETLICLKEKKLIPANSSWETDRAVILQRLVDAKKAETK